MHRKVAVAMAAVLALGVASCGGSDPLTKAEFTKQANAVCVKARARIERMKGAGGEIAALMQKGVAYERAKADGIRALDAPDELKAAITEYTHAITARGAYFEKASRRKKADFGVEFTEATTREDELAKSLGLRKCQENPGRG